MFDPILNNSGEVVAKRCRRCKVQKPIVEFYEHGKSKGGKPTKTANCKSCYNKLAAPRYEKQRIERKTSSFWPKYILKDCNSTDKKCGFTPGDLDIEWIAKYIKDGCCYCGNKTLRMGLDRIDNNLPHNKDNVKPACIRCNFIRKTMPYEAWIKLIPGLRQAEEQGLFQNWTGAFDRSGRRRKY